MNICECLHDKSLHNPTCEKPTTENYFRGNYPEFMPQVVQSEASCQCKGFRHLKVEHRFNNGRGATLCHLCSVIITNGLTDDLFCPACIDIVKEYYK